MLLPVAGNQQRRFHRLARQIRHFDKHLGLAGLQEVLPQRETSDRQIAALASQRDQSHVVGRRQIDRPVESRVAEDHDLPAATFTGVDHPPCQSHRFRDSVAAIERDVFDG